MENNQNQDPTSITVLLPLHRALTELFFIAEARAIVSKAQTQSCMFTQVIHRPGPKKQVTFEAALLLKELKVGHSDIWLFHLCVDKCY